MARECPARPTVQSTTVCPIDGERCTSTSFNMTGSWPVGGRVIPICRCKKGVRPLFSQDSLKRPSPITRLYGGGWYAGIFCNPYYNYRPTPTLIMLQIAHILLMSLYIVLPPLMLVGIFALPRRRSIESV